MNAPPNPSTPRAAVKVETTAVKTVENVIAGHPFLKDLKPDHLRLLADNAMRMVYQPGELIFREGLSEIELSLGAAIFLSGADPSNVLIGESFDRVERMIKCLRTLSSAAAREICILLLVEPNASEISVA